LQSAGDGRPRHHRMSAVQSLVADEPDPLHSDKRMMSLDQGMVMNVLARAVSHLARVNEITCLIGKHAGWVLIALMTAVILLQVFFRYGLGSALTWSEEVARFMMIWMTFLIAPVAYRHGVNVSLDIFASMIKGRMKAVLIVALHLLITLFLLIFFFESFGMIERGLKLKASTLSTKMAYIYMILPISFFLMFLIALELIGRALQDLIEPGRARQPKALPSPLLD
jgi:TRAP-type C4-dicarboxylate transport system permease small subunit